MKLTVYFNFSRRKYYTPVIFIFILLITLYLFQYIYVEKNVSYVNRTKLAKLSEKQILKTPLLNYDAKLKSRNPAWKIAKREYSCHDPFVSVSDLGRLGNNICELFSLYLFKIEFGIRTVISWRMYHVLSNIFQTIPLPHLPNPCFNTETKSRYASNFDGIYKIYKDSIIEGGNALNLTNIPHYTLLIHFPCPREKIISYRQQFRNLFNLKDNNIKIANYVIENLLKERKLKKSEIVLVGTHVRRTDFFFFAENSHLQYPPAEFYLKAFNFFRLKCKNAIFIVVSDDIEWCTKTLSAPDVIIAGNGNIDNPQIDFTLLTLCDHHIRGLGSFSFTSAFLGRGSAVIFRKRDLFEESKFTLKELSKSNFTCSSEEIFFVDG